MQDIDVFFTLAIVWAALVIAAGTIETKRWLEDMYIACQLKRVYKKWYWFLNYKGDKK